MRGRNIKVEQSSAVKLHNPYAGVPYAWQLSESVDDFLARLPPSATDASLELPWIYICNPYVDLHNGYYGALPRGCENEGPQRPGAQVSLFVEGANERLRIFETFCAIARSSGSSVAGKSRAEATLQTKERNEVVSDIAALARNLGVTCGKWMLFPEPDEVDDIWAMVARATAKGDLGVAAKVAPRPNNGMVDPEKTARLVCVYTKDFGDVEDVGRVLLGLKELGLVESSKRPIYYKTGEYNASFILSHNFGVSDTDLP